MEPETGYPLRPAETDASDIFQPRGCHRPQLRDCRRGANIFLARERDGFFHDLFPWRSGAIPPNRGMNRFPSRPCGPKGLGRRKPHYDRAGPGSKQRRKQTDDNRQPDRPDHRRLAGSALPSADLPGNRAARTAGNRWRSRRRRSSRSSSRWRSRRQRATTSLRCSSRAGTRTWSSTWRVVR